MEEMHRRYCRGQRCRVFMPSPGAPPSQHFSVLTKKFSGPPHLGVFMETLLCRQDWLNCLLLMIVSISSPAPLPQDQGPGWKFQPNQALIFLGTSPILKLSRGPQPPVISLAYRRHSYYSGDSKVLGTRCKDQIFIFFTLSQPVRFILWVSLEQGSFSPLLGQSSWICWRTLLLTAN